MKPGNRRLRPVPIPAAGRSVALPEDEARFFAGSSVSPLFSARGHIQWQFTKGGYPYAHPIYIGIGDRGPSG